MAGHFYSRVCLRAWLAGRGILSPFRRPHMPLHNRKGSLEAADRFSRYGAHLPFDTPTRRSTRLRRRRACGSGEAHLSLDGFPETTRCPCCFMFGFFVFVVVFLCRDDLRFSRHIFLVWDLYFWLYFILKLRLVSFWFFSSSNSCQISWRRCFVGSYYYISELV